MSKALASPSPSDRGRAVFARLRALRGTGPIVVAHRGDSRNHPENTLAAFAAATGLGAPMQEFDVQVAADGALVCLHDPTLDRTTDAAMVLGPGMLVSGIDLARLQQLDAGAWMDAIHAGARVPTLAQALATMLPRSIPMIEHKGGRAEAFVTELLRLALLDQVLLQSFDWTFVESAGQLAPALALGLLGPTQQHDRIDDAVVRAATSIGCGMVHWHAPRLTATEVELAHRHGLLVCTYTSDDELGWHGGRALGVDAMCTNEPARMLASLARTAAVRPDP